ncbi:SH3 domain-binding glutamic acid-rich protein homolog [Diachasmimorpha longicaudata]|uniref:SH3 domain-binding glutamic acid-rich protein homolog n=1 Tax=Diachasmimorpha longicaudata TaxID=58733 RepID=UPI0030B891A9
MVVKVYISGISGNKEVKKRQQRVMMILDSKNVEYEVIDITEPGKEDDKEYMQSMSNAKDNKHPLPPQIFNDEDYCGDYEDFDLANEIDELEKFLKVVSLDSSAEGTADQDTEVHMNVRQNGNTSSREASTDKDVSGVPSESEVNERQHSTMEDTEDQSKTVDDDLSTKSQADDGEMDDSIDKNEEKSDDQEKEE